MSAEGNPLFQPFQLGDLSLPNRIVMAPLTRNRATATGDVPSDLAVTYYAQRASAGFIISEASQISRQGQGYLRTPGIYTPEQVAGWRRVTDAVHAAGGRIFIQLWHVGRMSHVSLQKDGAKPVAPSAIRAVSKTFIESGFADTSEPRALELTEIAGIIADYEQAGRNAKEAGFDGVEIHAANGYLIDQFMKDGSNKRTDAYGGSIENRTRLAVEATKAILKTWDKSRVGIRLSPAKINDAGDSDPTPLFTHVIGRLNELGLAYIHMIEGATGGDRGAVDVDYVALRKAFSGAYIANNGYSPEMAREAVRNGTADLIAFGRMYVSNPDLVERLRIGAPLAEPIRETLYGGGAEGYTDYPTVDEAA